MTSYIDDISSLDHLFWLENYDSASQKMIANCYVDSMEEDLDTLITAIAHQTPDSTRNQLHKIKGGLAMIGHMALADAVNQMIGAIDSELCRTNWPRHRHECIQLSKIIEESIRVMKAWLKDHNEVNA
ncbi:hypothetical protein TW81_03790 [Vibrio galatheae]|uniref:HPt domain-containing protein n=1 Tax=Vibrio galatheae TaxID=579748 RepID=A0A0F4NND5_9VIBR|nr:Hpt domain-containing protein [Vibrio galatheae]KJY84660.1 hypothetical protein TW81_03790 [Vibrio galatheae]